MATATARLAIAVWLGADLETMGPQLQGDPDACLQHRIIQLGAVAFDHDWRVLHEVNLIVRPDGPIAPGTAAEAVHGISPEMAVRYGIPLGAALAVLQGLVMASQYVFGHGIQGFDRRVIGAEIERVGGTGLWWSKASAKIIDTMELATPICQIEGPFGYKYPSLTEANEILCPEMGWKGRHSAKHDVIGSANVLRALIARGVVRI